MGNWEIRIKNYLSALLPFLIILSVWPKIHYYDIQIFRLTLAGLIVASYISYRIYGKGAISLPKWWWLVVAIFGYFFLSLATSPNKDVGLARLVLLFTFGLLYFAVKDLFKYFLTRSVALKAFIVAIGLMMVLATGEVLSKYRNWWEVFGRGVEKPPFVYRINITMQANHWLALANLFLPLVVILLFTSKDKGLRWLAGIWVLFYALVAFFSSSRGGYVAIAAGLGVLLALQIKWGKILIFFRNLSKARRLILIIVFLIAIGGLGFVFYSFFLQSSAHPSHGGEAGGLNFNRLGIWSLYFNEWKESPIFGVGIGRSVFGLFGANQTIPPGWLPLHSHNMPLGILSEFGLVGAALIFAAIILATVRVIRLFDKQVGDERLQAGGVIAGVSTMLFHSMFEDFTLEPVVMSCGIVLIAWLASHEKDIDENSRVRVPVFWLGVTAILVGVMTYWYLAPTKYLSAAVLSQESPNAMNSIQKAELVEKAIAERPNSHYFLTQGTLFWMEAWEENQGIDEIYRAEELVSEALLIEPDESYQWMNRAAINWAQGDFSDALSDVERAVSLAPLEPVYYLNLGWYYESLGEQEAASQYYLIALQNSDQLDWATHPFWQQNELRKFALDEYFSENPALVIDSQLDEFWNAFKTGDIAAARKIYKRIEWQKSFGNPPLGSLLGGLLAIDERDIPKAFTLIEKSYKSVYEPARLSPLNDWKRFYYRTSGIGWPFVPGVLQLSQDYGQFELYEEILPLLEQHLSSEQLCELEKEYTLAVSGGQLWQDGVFIPSICD